MNAFVSAFCRDVSCATAAAVITIIVGLAFVQSTDVAPRMQHIVAAKTAPAANQA